MEFTELALILPVVGLGLVIKLVLKTGIMKVIGLPLEVPVVVRGQELYYTNHLVLLNDGILGILINHSQIQ